MARLIVLRHAKSDYPPGVPDRDRPLSDRGRRDAPEAGRWLLSHDLVPDLAIVSTAVRTQQTWGLVAAELNPAPALGIEPRIYDASVRDLLEVVAGVDDAVGTLLLVGHNPGLEMLASLLAGSARGDALDRLEAKFPTSAIAVLEWEGSWAAVAPGIAQLVEFVIPRA